MTLNFQKFIQRKPNNEVRKLMLLRAALLLIASLLSGIGSILIYSASHGDIIMAKKQASCAITLLLLAIPIYKLKINLIYSTSTYVYLLLLSILLATVFLGYTHMGAQRWLRLGFLQFQPSEFMKIWIILLQAKYFHDRSNNKLGWSNVFASLFIGLVPALLILKQPNLGTALISIFIPCFMLFAAGISRKKILTILILILLASPLGWYKLHDYQRQRIMTFLNPRKDPLGAGYNVIQSEVAIGSGGLRGEGFMQGSQNQLYFLPENHTDFIFTLLAEEFGFIGVCLVLAIYLAMIFCLISITLMVKGVFCRMTCIGVCSMLFVHVFINVGMISGLMPVTGIPLPFLSFGRSSLTSFWLSIALVVSITKREHVRGG